MSLRRRAALGAAVVLLAGCSSADDDASTTAPASASTSGATTSTVSPARATLDEIVGWMANPTTIDTDRFSAEFLAQVPPDELTSVFESLGAGDWQATDVTESRPGELVATLEGQGTRLAVQLVLDGDGRIAGLLFEPVGLTDPPATLAELTERLAASAETTGFLAATIAADGTCTSVEELAADRPLPLGSVFKLYVLGAVATAIENGSLSWDDPVTIRDELDSLPSGTTQDEPAGSTLTVRELAQRMIEVSDNTATDHLIDLVGRDAVEAALTTLGHADPQVTLPFLNTREIFVIKTDDDLLARYEAADEAGRRALLDGEVAAAPLPSVEQFPTAPRAVTTVEWFASPLDVCNALVALDDLAARPGLEPIGDILSTNPGIADVPAGFTRVLFKGGSEPGVLYVAWLATRPDGSRIVVTGGAADSTSDIEATTSELLSTGLRLI